MNKILKDRVVLIRTMMTNVEKLYEKDFVSCEEKLVLENLIDQIRQNKNEHFLSISQEASFQVSYARIPEHKYDTVKRVRCPLGRYILRNLEFDKKKMRESVLSKFVQNVWANIESDVIDVHVLKGNDIVEAYRSLDNSSAGSCMTGSCSRFVKLYALNPDKVSLLIYDEIRALLWKTDQGAMVFDRCYPSGHCMLEVFREWAKKQNYVLRSNADRLCDFNLIKLTDNKTYTVTLVHNDCFPYLDTFCYGNIIGDKVVLSNSRDDYRCRFQDQEGEYGILSRSRCAYCYTSLVEGWRFFEGSCYCDSCFESFINICSVCSTLIHTNNSWFSESETDHAVYCENCFKDKYCFCACCGKEIEVIDVFANDLNDCYCYNCYFNRKSERK